ncbi:hypothetical protein QTH90_06230 [Variovorax sp. J2P1-59]|uniref:hypothetical protein n=1 Tax=Variovorax flavidus TaxID=3053501 RepID=UPI0025759A39|nr:hypothetical protein [Variovorax sp. J2P1-59]MDM0073971.1 hypothetical protein [Variovorax sp. J2P1-59]
MIDRSNEALLLSEFQRIVSRHDMPSTKLCADYVIQNEPLRDKRLALMFPHVAFKKTLGKRTRTS